MHSLVLAGRRPSAGVRTVVMRWHAVPAAIHRVARSRAPSAPSRIVRWRIDARPGPTEPPAADEPARSRSRSRAALESPGGTSRPLTPSSMASGVPPTRVATTGRPAAIDSRSTLESALVERRHHRHRDAGEEFARVRSQAGEHHAIDHAELRSEADQLGPVGTIVGTGLPDNEKAHGREPGGDDRGCFEKRLEALQPAQTRHDADQRRPPVTSRARPGAAPMRPPPRKA